MTAYYVPSMYTYEELEKFFGDTARATIRSNAKCKCVFCKLYLKADEGHYVPLVDGPRTVRHLSLALFSRI